MKKKKEYEVPQQELILVRFEENYVSTGDPDNPDVPNPGGEVEPGGWN